MKDMKYDAGKPRPSLILKSMSRALLEVSKVATFGAEKYAEDSWLTVKDGEKRYRDAKDRHMLQGAFETVDSESGISHLAHEAWNALALLELSLRGETIDTTRDVLEPNWTESAEVRSSQIMQNGNDGEHYREMLGKSQPKCEYTLDDVIGEAELSDCARWVAVDKDGEVWVYSQPPLANNHSWRGGIGVKVRYLNKKVVPPFNFKNCIWEIKK